MDKDQAFARLIQAVEYLKDNGQARTQMDMAALMGVRQPHLASALNGDYKRLTEGFLRKFAAAYSDYINEEWLLTGEGEMAVPDKTMRPHFEAKVCAGFMCGVAEGEVGTLHPHIPGMRDYDFTIEAEGNSMLPRIESGDLLACRRMNDRSNPPFGKICVIDGKDGAAVKVLADADDNFITLHSLNASYHDYKVALTDVLGIAEVVGLVRSF